jgi:hypothetical protein
VVGGDAPCLRLDQGYALSPELDALLRDLGVGEQDVCGCLAAEEDVQLRVTEVERLVLVDERDADVLGERLGESRRQLQAGEAGTQGDDVLLRHVRGR